MEIKYLADCIEWATTLAEWHFQEWHKFLPEWSRDEALEELLTHKQRRSIPTTLIAVENSKMIGSVSLVLVDNEELTNLSPWLASLFVALQWRGKGIARKLVERAVEEASEIGISRLYVYTPHHEAFYLHLGWTVMEKISLAIGEATIFYLDLLA